MRGGFTFCGIDIADLGLEYAPDNTNTYVFRHGDYKVNEQSFDAHDGGYYYGTTVNPKLFTLRCIYEEQHINEGVISRINNLFKRGKTGRLVFANRPWVWYVATVTSLATNQITNYQNGIITIQMKAYYPFGRCDNIFCSDEDLFNKVMKGNSALLSEAKTPSTVIATSDNPMTSSASFTLYNGGTERAAVAIEIAGDFGEGVLVTNATTGQTCRFVALTADVSTSVGKYLVCDGLNGMTVLTDGVSSELAFLYHDYGFIELEPAFPILRDLSVEYTSGSTAISCSEPVFFGTQGKHIYLDGEWREIVSVQDDCNATILPAPGNDGTETTELVQMNKITVTPASEMNLTKLSFRYNPTFE